MKTILFILVIINIGIYAWATQATPKAGANEKPSEHKQTQIEAKVGGQANAKTKKQADASSNGGRSK